VLKINWRPGRSWPGDSFSYSVNTSSPQAASLDNVIEDTGWERVQLPSKPASDGRISVCTAALYGMLELVRWFVCFTIEVRLRVYLVGMQTQKRFCEAFSLPTYSLYTEVGTVKIENQQRELVPI
jgi:hypothetical protein